MATRKAIAAALLALLNGQSTFTKVGRRLVDPEQAAAVNQPGLFLIKPTEKYTRDDRGTPGVKTMDFYAVIYTDVGNDANAVPADVIDDLLDIIDVQLRPTGADLVETGRQTLGGRVYDCRISGDPDIAPGDANGKGETVIPIEVILP